MALTTRITGTAWEDGGATCLARIVGGDGSNIIQTDVSSIARNVFDLDSSAPDTAVDTSTPAVASVVFDTLQTDSRWTQDTTGYNFRDIVAASILSDSHRYLVEYKLVPASGEPYWVVFEVRANRIRSS